MKYNQHPGKHAVKKNVHKKRKKVCCKVYNNGIRIFFTKYIILLFIVRGQTLIKAGMY